MDQDRPRLLLEEDFSPQAMRALVERMRPPMDERHDLQDWRVLYERDMELRTRSLDQASRWRGEAGRLLSDLRAAGTGAAGWTAGDISGAVKSLRPSERELDAWRTCPAYRSREVTNVPAAIDGLHRTLGDAGPGAVFDVVTLDAAGSDGRFVTVHDGGEARWLESESELPVEPPENGAGELIDPPPGLQTSMREMRSFSSVRGRVLATAAAHVDPVLIASGARDRATLYRSATGFEDRVAAEEARTARLVGITPPRIVILATAVRGDVPAEAHLCRDEQGRHGVGRAEMTVRGWTPVGVLRDFRSVFWLMEHVPRQAPTVRPIAGRGLGSAVRYLSGVDRTTAERAQAAFGEYPAMRAEVVDTLPGGLPKGSWIWFSGPLRATSAVVTTRHRVLLSGRDEVIGVSGRVLPDPLNTTRRAIVIGWSSMGRQADVPLPRSDSKPGVPRKGKGLAPGTKPWPGVDHPRTIDPYLYVNTDGRHRVAADGLTEYGWTDKGELSCIPASWLTRRGDAPSGPTGAGSAVNPITDGRGDGGQRDASAVHPHPQRSPQGESGAADVVDGAGPTVGQAGKLERRGWELVDVLVNRDSALRAMQAVAPRETSRAARGRPTATGDLWAYVLDALSTDRDPSQRRFWPVFDRGLDDSVHDGSWRSVIAMLSATGTEQARDSELMLAQPHPGRPPRAQTSRAAASPYVLQSAGPGSNPGRGAGGQPRSRHQQMRPFQYGCRAPHTHRRERNRTRAE